MAGETGACVIYAGTLNEDGYGVLPAEMWGTRLAHRAALGNHLGRPVQGVTRHRCHVRACVAPLHLLEGTQAQNVDDTWEAGRARGGRCNETHCKWGHEMTPENTAYKIHRSTRKNVLERVCVACRRRRNQELAARRKAERARRKEIICGG